MEKIGFVGLGIMGKPMSKNLLKAGYKLVVYDIVPKPLEELKQAGAEIGTSPSDVASKADVIITMLPNSPHVKQAILGEKGVADVYKRQVAQHRVKTPLSTSPSGAISGLA